MIRRWIAVGRWLAAWLIVGACLGGSVAGRGAMDREIGTCGRGPTAGGYTGGGHGEEIGGAERRAAARAAWARAGPSGLRRVVAGWSWVQARRAWEREDVRGFRQALFAAVSLRPEHRGYWIDGARMLAFDVPQWRGGGLRERRWGVEEALRFLERAEDAHPEASDIPLEVGWLRGWELGDFEGAQRALERAARLAPRIGPAARLRARALERLGRLEEARAWLTEMETVPPQSLREGFEVPAAAVEPRRGRVP